MNIFLALSGLFGGLGVGMGAFAAHGLRTYLSEGSLQLLETAVRYQMIHALALGLVAILLTRLPSAGVLWAAGWAFGAGVLLFSGSLYALAFTGIRWLGAITPVGGVAFLIGWACLALSARAVP
ncbi:DUF423 domain-containing protein [Thermostichus vulcanus]|uniref:DUF423 domain-containing protein n=1 Tax=Thermostichus vulcanus str. 'Rupite' TaxID=2813851 RepID=A0ABT0C7W5_THEVL|nr:DUF423 domain-containing protein [Thermostichus vulcanus]MCJ2541784.1 DUF423 domain-containing protein [Thermostichus vulcanus str. 'Rupite']